MATRVVGKVVVHTRGFGFLELEAPEASDADGEGRRPPTAFVSPPELNPFLAGDRVSAELVTAGDGRVAARELALVERRRSELFGTVVHHGKRAHLRVDRTVANTDWRLQGDGAADVDALADGTLIVARVVGDGAPVAALERVVPPADASLERVRVRHGLRTDYPPEVQSEALSAAQAAVRADAAWRTARRDLRDIPTITIDGPTSRDLDDAIAVLPAGADGALRLLVSIADVDALVPEGSPIDREARRRGTSVYLAGRVINMLPPSLSEDALSLLPGVDRPALTVEIRIDPEGEVTATDIYTSLIRSHARLSYEQAAAFLDRDDPSDMPDSVRPTLRWARTAAARIGAVRTGRGGVELLREEAYVTLDDATREPTKIDARTDTSANLLIERLMVATNEAVARWMVDRGLPGVFRVHDEPEPERVRALAESARHFGFELGLADRLTSRGLAALDAQFATSAVGPAMRTVLQRVLGPARYTVHPSQHYGLAAPLYLHFTSPIRRYADLAVHRVVKAFLAGQRDFHPREPAIEALSQDLNEQNRRAAKAEAERLRMLAARLFTSRIGERFRGNVVAVKPFGLIVQLVGLGVSGTLQADTLPGGPFEVDLRGALVGHSTRWSIGEPLEVEVAGASEELGRIDLIIGQMRK